MAAAQSVRSGQRNQFAVVETHPVKDVSNVLNSVWVLALV
jgi:hypothetical protein